MASPIIGAQEIESTVIVEFFKDFDDAVSRARESRNKIVKQMVESGKLLASQVDDYIDEHPVALETVYSDLYANKEFYPEMMKLLKLTLLITPSTANVERGFSVLTMLVTKQRNSLSTRNIDRLMRIVLLGPDDFSDPTWDLLVEKFKNMKDRRLDL